MLVLNLLPLAEKENLKQGEIQRWVGFYGSVCLAIIFIFVFLLVLIWSYLLIQLDYVSANLEHAQGVFKEQGLKKDENKINELNDRLRLIDTAQKEQLYYSRILTQLMEIIPSGVSFKNISINGKERAAISGFAGDREQVLLIKNNLEKSAYFKNIDSPLSNIVQQKDINFTFSFDVNLELLNDN